MESVIFQIIGRLVLSLVLTGPLASGALAAEERLGEHLLFVRGVPGAPTKFQMIVRAGCADETGGECRGLAHYLEHLVMAGRNPEHQEIALRFFPNGLSDAYTTQLTTRYIHTIPLGKEGPRADLEKLFAFYAARLNTFFISDEDAERERNVVRQELDSRIQGRPFVLLSRRLDRLLLPDHPMGQWPIGTSEYIAAYRVDDAREFHRTWYTLDNVYFVVMADIDAQVLKSIADAALAKIERRPLPPRPSERAPAVIYERIDVREQDTAIRLPGVIFKKLVRIGRDDATLQLVGDFLISRLPGSPHDVIIDRAKLASGISIVIGNDAPNTIALTIAADAATADTQPAQLLAAVERYVDALATNRIPAGTIARLQTRAAQASATADQIPEQVYTRLTKWLVERNRYEDLASWAQRIAAVSPNNVAAVLQGLAGPGRIVTGILVPMKAKAE